MPFQKPVQKSLSQHKRMRKLRSYEEKGILMQYHSINIEKLQKQMKNKFSNIAYQIRTLEGYTLAFLLGLTYHLLENRRKDDVTIYGILFVIIRNK